MFDTLTVLLVEDDADVLAGATQALRLAGLSVRGFTSAEPVLALLHADFPGVLVTDVRLPGLDGLELLRRAMALDPKLPVVLVTGHGDISMAVDAMRSGAYDFIQKPFASDRLVDTVQRALERRSLMLEVEALRRKLSDRQGIEALLLGQSPGILAVRTMILQIAETGVDVLIQGETGTGKEMVARCLHQYSSRRERNFVALNCGGMPEALFESEVFGHEAGAFTGALRARVGQFEYADGGTLFLDEIESMPAVLQVKLLRVIQERSVQRLGANRPIPVDLRIVAATKDDLAEQGRKQRFREDLYYRLNVVTIDLPPLRERREDIPMLFEHFVLQAASRYGREAPIATRGQMLRLMAHPWPGNVRELRNIADRFVLRVHGGNIDLSTKSDDVEPSLGEQLESFERSLIAETMRRHGGDVGAASDSLKLPRKTLYDRLRRLGLTIDSFR